jgi:UDP-glucose-4-epimerase GalE
MLVVTGGAGYIGSVVVRQLREAGRDVFVVDDLRGGHADALEGVPHVVADVLEARLDWEKVEGVLHFAALIQVEESTRRPELYRRNNVEAAQRFLGPAVERGLPIVFSSTAAVYGEPSAIPIPEDHPTAPVNPYGETKLAMEKWLRERGARAAVFRYFNAAGGNERHRPETHLIPRLLASTEPFPIYGNDYPTRDGTCVRDYIHVEDLARAHVMALGRTGTWNLGSGTGHTVLEVVRQAGKPHRFESRRAGDAAALVADISRARRELGWEPRLTLADILGKR